MQIEAINCNMYNYINRDLKKRLDLYLDTFPVVLITGPRQCGKSTFVKNISKSFDSFLYLDLQKASDLNKLSNAELFFEANSNKVICLDEVQLIPDLFSILRSVIDENRINGRFILLGSASRDLIQKSSESLAGRIGMLNMSVFNIKELESERIYQRNKYWVNGGFPESYLSDSNEKAQLWLENYINTYVERDIPRLGFNISSNNLLRLLRMTAHYNGQIINYSKIGDSLGLSHTSIMKYLDILEQTFIIKRLPVYEVNMKKRLVKSPKIYIRDIGLFNKLLNISDFNSLLSHPGFGASWEAMVLENLQAVFSDAEFYFFRTARGDEIDLIMKFKNKIIALETKATKSPKVNKGFWNSLKYLKPDKTYIVSPIDDKYPIHNEVEVIGLELVIDEINKFISNKQNL